MMIEAVLAEVLLDEQLQAKIVVLTEKDGERSFPVYIGAFEYVFLEQALKREKPARPLTHDLIISTIDTLGGKLTGVVIDELRDNTFVAKLLVRTGDGEVLRIDSRASDAMILSVKEGVPIYVESDVMERATATGPDGEDDEDSDDL